MRDRAMSTGTSKIMTGSTSCRWYCGCGGAQLSGGNIVSATVASATTQCVAGTSVSATRTGAIVSTSTRNNSTPGNVDRLAPNITDRLSRALCAVLASVNTGCPMTIGSTPPAGSAGP